MLPPGRIHHGGSGGGERFSGGESGVVGNGGWRLGSGEERLEEERNKGNNETMVG